MPALRNDTSRVIQWNDGGAADRLPFLRSHHLSGFLTGFSLQAEICSAGDRVNPSSETASTATGRTRRHSSHCAVSAPGNPLACSWTAVAYRSLTHVCAFLGNLGCAYPRFLCHGLAACQPRCFVPAPSFQAISGGSTRGPNRATVRSAISSGTASTGSHSYARIHAGQLEESERSRAVCDGDVPRSPQPPIRADSPATESLPSGGEQHTGEMSRNHPVGQGQTQRDMTRRTGYDAHHAHRGTHQRPDECGSVLRLHFVECSLSILRARRMCRTSRSSKRLLLEANESKQLPSAAR